MGIRCEIPGTPNSEHEKIVGNFWNLILNFVGNAPPINEVNYSQVLHGR